MSVARPRLTVHWLLSSTGGASLENAVWSGLLRLHTPPVRQPVFLPFFPNR